MNLYEIITTQQDTILRDSLHKFIEEGLGEFKEVLAATGNSLGGISVAEAFWLYHLIKAVKPKQIIESGTFYGYSLHFITKAATDCRVMSFDIDQSKSPKYNGVEYYEHDWMECKDLMKGERTLVFFDDHIDQGRRLGEAVERDQEHLVFHDNYLTLKHSHLPIRFCDLKDASLCYTFLPIYTDPVFTNTTNNAQTYRWLTYVKRGDL